MLCFVVLRVGDGARDVTRIEPRDEACPTRLGETRRSRDRHVERCATFWRAFLERREPAIRERRKRRERLVTDRLADRLAGAPDVAHAREKLGTDEPRAVGRQA